MVAAGHPTREIALRLGISAKTVENHKHRIFSKLGVHNQAHAVSIAMRAGILTPASVVKIVDLMTASAAQDTPAVVCMVEGDHEELWDRARELAMPVVLVTNGE